MLDGRLERDVVVVWRVDGAHVVVMVRSAAGTGTSRCEPVALRPRGTVTAAASATAEQDHTVGANFGRLDLLAFLVGPFARLDLAFDVDLLALGQVRLNRFGRLSPDDDAMPLGVFTLLPVAIGEVIGRGNAHRRDGGAARGESHLRISSEVANQNGLVHASHSPSFALSRETPRVGGACYLFMRARPCVASMNALLLGKDLRTRSQLARARSVCPSCS